MKKTYLTILMLLIPLTTLQAEDLISIYRQAQLGDPNLKTAQLQIDVGKAQYWQAGSALLPQISASANLSLNRQRNIKTKTEDAFKGERYSINLTQTIIDVPKILNVIRSDKLVAQFIQASEEAEQVLMQTIVERYLAVLGTQDNLRLIQREITLTEKQSQQLRRLFEKRIIKITDVYEMEARLDLLKADQVDSETRLIVARAGLSELTGEKIGTLARLRDEVDFVALSGSLEQRIIQARSLNTALLAQEKAIEASDYEISIEHSRHLPTVDLQLNYFRSNTGFNNSLSSSTETKVAAININLPIFSGGASIARAHEARKNREINRQRKITLLRGIIKETRDAFLSTNASVRRIEAAKKALNSSTKAYEAMQKGFKYGVQTISDVLISQQREFTARKELLAVRYTYINHWVRLQKSTGLMTVNSLEIINQWLGKEVL